MRKKYLPLLVLSATLHCSMGEEIHTSGTIFPGDKLGEKRMQLLYLGMETQKILKNKSKEELVKICDSLIRIKVILDSKVSYFEPFEMTMVSLKHHDRPNELNSKYSSWVSYSSADSYTKTNTRITSFEKIGSKVKLEKHSASMLKWNTQNRIPPEETLTGATEYSVEIINKGKYKSLNFFIATGEGKKEKEFLLKLRSFMVNVGVPLTRILPHKIVRQVDAKAKEQ